MSEEQQDPNNVPPQAPVTPPQPRRLIAGATSGSGPRLRMGTGEGMSNLKISMTPEQEAAIARAKAIQEAEAQQAAAAEARYAEEQAKYEAELKAFQEFQAAQAAAEAAGQTAPAPEPAAIPTQDTTPAPAVEAPAPVDPQAAAYQQSAPVDPQAAFYQQSAPTPAPSPTIPPVAIPAVQPTTPFPGTTASFLPGSQRMAPAQEGPPIAFWKKPIVFLPFLLIVMGLLAGIFYYLPQKKEKERLNELYHTYAVSGKNDDIKTLTATPSDAKFILERLKTDNTNWQAASSAVNKIMRADPSFALTVLDTLKKDYKAYLMKGGDNLKVRRLYYYALSQPQFPDGMRAKVLDFYDSAPDDYKPEVLYVGYKVFAPEDLEFIINIINSPATANNPKLRVDAERTAVQIMKISPDKKYLTETIMRNYKNANDNLKNVYLRLMGRTGSQEGLDFLKNILLNKDSGEIAYRNILTALGAWPNDDAIAILLQFKDSPQAQGEMQKYVKKELLRSLSTPGRVRDMKKVEPLLKSLQSDTSQEAKLEVIAGLSGNAKTDKWALDVLQKYAKDDEDKVNYAADKAIEKVGERQPPAETQKKEISVEEEMEAALKD